MPFHIPSPHVIVPPGGGKHGAVLIAGYRQYAALSEKASKLASEGNVVELLMPRGLPAPTESSRPFSGNWIMDTRAWLIGLNLPGMRARDIAAAVSELAARPDVDASNIRAEGDGIAGIWLLMAAATEPRIKSVTLHGTPYSLRAAITDDQTLARNLHEAVIPGFALKWDLADLVHAIRPRQVIWVDPTDWMGHVKHLPGDYRYNPAEQ